MCCFHNEESILRSSVERKVDLRVHDRREENGMGAENRRRVMFGSTDNRKYKRKVARINQQRMCGSMRMIRFDE